jgi:hypothetical protein
MARHLDMEVYLYLYKTKKWVPRNLPIPKYNNNIILITAVTTGFTEELILEI